MCSRSSSSHVRMCVVLLVFLVACYTCFGYRLREQQESQIASQDCSEMKYIYFKTGAVEYFMTHLPDYGTGTIKFINKDGVGDRNKFVFFPFEDNKYVLTLTGHSQYCLAVTPLDVPSAGDRQFYYLDKLAHWMHVPSPSDREFCLKFEKNKFKYITTLNVTTYWFGSADLIERAILHTHAEQGEDMILSKVASADSLCADLEEA
eukprot:TRINITY_DN12369_c0_g1_i1.p1 TRINITY_DN12369_c0_g1~~TRINITY_DN12369_c0_g1_i1.p1  ORF type:complete len:205 (+),score=28.09 TRINITY_DN12369_c0_g1_i1:49-663(+)